mgnify:CR=1 FL=1
MKKIFRYIILACMFLMLVACGKKDSEKAFDEKVKEVKEQVTKNGEEGLESTKLLAKLFNKATYKVNKVEENGDSAQLDVTIKAVNLGKYVNEYIVAATEKYGENVPADKQEEFNQFSVDYFTNVLNDKNVEYIETEVDVQMEKSEEGWIITNPNDLVSATLGGAGSLIGL